MAVGPLAPPAPFRSLYSEQLDDIDKVAVRVKTYVLWPSWAPPDISTESLALAGLYYTGDGDQTRCFSCRRVFSDWREGMDPLVLHRQRAPECVYIKLVVARSSLEVELRGCNLTNDSKRRLRDNSSAEGRDSVDGASIGRGSSENFRSGIGSARVGNFGHNYENHSRHDVRDSLHDDGENLQHDGENLAAENNFRLSEDGNIQILPSSRSEGGSLESDSIGVEEPGSPDLTMDAEGEESEGEGEGPEGEGQGENLTAVTSWTRLPISRNPGALRAENAALRSTVTCRQCKHAPVQTLFLPCRHLVSCEACAEAVETCTHCHAQILGTVRTYIV